MKKEVKCNECDGDMVLVAPKVIFEFNIPYTQLEFSVVSWNNPNEQYCPTCVQKEADKLEEYIKDPY